MQNYPLDLNSGNYRSPDQVAFNVNSNNNSSRINNNVNYSNNAANIPNSDRVGLVANSYNVNRQNSSTNIINNANPVPSAILGNSDGYYSTGNMRESSIGAGPGIYEPDTRSIGSKVSKFTYSGKHNH